MGNRSAAATLLALAQETRDVDALDAIAQRDEGLLKPPLVLLRRAAGLARDGQAALALDELDGAGGETIGLGLGASDTR